MKIYCPVNPVRDKRDAFCRLTFANDADRKRFAIGEHFRGLPLSAPLLEPYQVKRSTEFPGGDAAPLGDRQGIGFNTDPMAVSRRALEVLLPQIDQLVQIVPLRFDEGEYALLNIVNVVDALDVARSDIEYFPSSGRISRVKRHVFHTEIVRDQWIFKIPQTPTRAFVNDRFVQLVQQAGLTGFDFEEVWSGQPEMSEPSHAH